MTATDVGQRGPGRGTQPLLAWAWLLAFALLAEPYRGVRHDAILYYAQAMRHLGAAWSSVDVFFRGGSQDQFTLFPRLLAPVLSAFGLAHGEMLALAALYALQLWSFAALTRPLPPRDRWLALAVLLVMPHNYGDSHRFGFSEPFVTARSLAEPLAVFALAGLSRGGWVRAAVLFTLAMLVHPLIAIPGVLVGGLMLSSQDRRWLWLAAFAATAAALAALAGVRPLDGMFRSYDPAWFALVNRADGFVFLGRWGQPAWQQLALDLGLLWFASRDRTHPLARAMRVSMWVAAGGCAVSYVTADLLHLQLFTQLQLWRATWLGHLFAMLGLAALCRQHARGTAFARAALALTLLAAVMVEGGLSTAWVVEAAAFGALVLADRHVVVGSGIITTVVVTCALGAMVVTGVQALAFSDVLASGDEGGLMVSRTSALFVVLPAVMLALVAAAAWTLRSPAASAKPAGWLAVAGLLALGAAQWDQRAPWDRYVESHADGHHPFDAAIPPRATVLWYGHLLAPWALLQRSSYFAPAQASGSLFSRDAAFALDRRLEVVRPFDIQTNVCRSLLATGLVPLRDSACHVSDVAARDVCHLHPPGPDYLVLDAPLQAPADARWTFTPGGGAAPIPYYLYACRRIS